MQFFAFPILYAIVTDFTFIHCLFNNTDLQLLLLCSCLLKQEEKLQTKIYLCLLTLTCVATFTGAVYFSCRLKPRLCVLPFQPDRSPSTDQLSVLFLSEHLHCTFTPEGRICYRILNWQSLSFNMSFY